MFTTSSSTNRDDFRVPERIAGYVPSQSNLFLIQAPTDAGTIYEAKLRQRVIIRPMNAYGLPNSILLNPGLPEENERFIKALGHTLQELSGAL